MSSTETPTSPNATMPSRSISACISFLSWRRTGDYALPPPTLTSKERSKRDWQYGDRRSWLSRTRIPTHCGLSSSLRLPSSIPRSFRSRQTKNKPMPSTERILQRSVQEIPLSTACSNKILPLSTSTPSSSRNRPNEINQLKLNPESLVRFLLT